MYTFLAKLKSSLNYTYFPNGPQPFLNPAMLKFLSQSAEAGKSIFNQIHSEELQKDTVDS